MDMPLQLASTAVSAPAAASSTSSSPQTSGAFATLLQQATSATNAAPTSPISQESQPVSQDNRDSEPTASVKKNGTEPERRSPKAVLNESVPQAASVMIAAAFPIRIVPAVATSSATDAQGPSVAEQALQSVSPMTVEGSPMCPAAGVTIEGPPSDQPNAGFAVPVAAQTEPLVVPRSGPAAPSAPEAPASTPVTQSSSVIPNDPVLVDASSLQPSPEATDNVTNETPSPVAMRVIARYPTVARMPSGEVTKPRAQASMAVEQTRISAPENSEAAETHSPQICAAAETTQTPAVLYIGNSRTNDPAASVPGSKTASPIGDQAAGNFVPHARDVSTPPAIAPDRNHEVPKTNSNKSEAPTKDEAALQSVCSATQAQIGQTPHAPDASGLHLGRPASLDAVAVPAEPPAQAPELSTTKPQHQSQAPAAAWTEAVSSALPPTTVHGVRLADGNGQSEMHIDLRTTAFGSVEVHAVIRDSQVGLAIGSERGDLRHFLANEVPAIAGRLEQQDLRLDTVKFFNQGVSMDAGLASGSHSGSRSFSADRMPPFATHESRPPTALDSEPETFFYTGRGLNVRA